MEPLKVGLIGCGRIAQSLHLRILTRMPDVEVIALAGPGPQRRVEARCYAPGAAACGGYHDLLKLLEVDAVIISVPNALHAEVAMAALERGKHVYLEKPLATSLEDGERVLAAWRWAGVVGMIGFNYRFSVLYEAARQQIQSGRLGTLVGVRSVFSTPARPLSAWEETRRSGGGVCKRSRK